MAQLNPKLFLRRLSINTSSSNPSTSSTTASPTQGNGGGGAVSSPNNSLMYQLDGYKSLISKSKLASPRLHSDGPMLGDHGEDRTPATPIAVPIKDFDRRASSPSIVAPVPLSRVLDGRTSTTPMAVPSSLARGFDGRAPLPVPALSSRDLDIYGSTPPIAVPGSLSRGFEGHTSTPAFSVTAPMARGFDGRVSASPIPMSPPLTRGLDGRTSTPTTLVSSPLAADLDDCAPTSPIPVPALPGRDVDGRTSTPSIAAPTSLSNAINGRVLTPPPPAIAPAPLPKGYESQTSPPSTTISVPPTAELDDGNSAPLITTSAPPVRELEDGSPPASITVPAPPIRELGGALIPSTAMQTSQAKEVKDDSSTPSISKPTQTGHSRTGAEEAPIQEDGTCPQPPREGDSRGHRSVSISFDPKVTLDNGRQYALEQPLPKPKSGIDIGLRGRSMLKELADEQTHDARTRAHSDSERTKYDPVTGEPVRHGRRVSSENISQLQPGQSHYPLIQSTVDALARNSDLQDHPRMPSLTSEITASPLIEEVRTPLRPPAEYSLSPLGMYSHLDEPTSLLETSAWPTIPRSPRMTTHKSFSQSLDKRGTKHRSRRAQSDRSPSATSMSPASAYLSMWVPAGRPVPSEPDDEGQEVGEYVIGKQIGFGGFSVVKEAFTIENDIRIRRAVKIVRKKVIGKQERENEQLQTDFEHEVLLWRLLNHRHILPLIAVYDTDFATFCFTQLNTGGTLFDLVRDNRKGLKSELARRYSFQLASALRYLHEDMHVVHRDIKLENCLLDMTGPYALTEGGNLLLCDFGMAEFVTSDGTAEARDGSQSLFENNHLHKTIGPSDTSTSIVGSLPYAAPERVNGSAEALTTAVDIWAFGVVVFCLLTGDLPFKDTFQPRVPLLIMRGDWDERALRSAQGALGSEDMVVEVVRGCLQLDIDIRWNVGQVLTSEWLENCEEDEDGWKF